MLWSAMQPDNRTRVLSLFWNFTVGGVAQYAALLEGVSTCAPIAIRSFCVLGPKHNVDQTSLDKFGDKVIVRRSVPWDTAWIGRLRRELHDWSPDIVVSHGFNSHFLAWIAAVISDSPFRPVCTYHGQYHAPTPARRLIGGVYNRFTDHYIRCRACSTVAVAEYGRDYLIEKGTDPARVEVIHNGIPDVEEDHQARARLREEWGVRPEETLVGVVSRLDPFKGVTDLVDAFGRVADRYPQARLVLIGSGSIDDTLRAQVNDLGLSGRVVFTGFRTDVVDCLSAMDIFVLPSLAETHSIGLLEAMRAAKPIIVTDVGGNTESTRHELEALVVPPADAAAIAMALERFFTDEPLRSRLGLQARARFLDEFTADRMVGRTAKWLERVVALPVPCR